MAPQEDPGVHGAVSREDEEVGGEQRADVAAYGNKAVIFPRLVWKVWTGPESSVVGSALAFGQLCEEFELNTRQSCLFLSILMKKIMK